MDLLQGAGSDIQGFANDTLYNLGFLYLFDKTGLEDMIMRKASNDLERMALMASAWGAANMLKKTLEAKGFKINVF